MPSHSSTEEFLQLMACALGSTCGPGQAPEQGGFIRFFSDLGGNALLDPSLGFCGEIGPVVEVEEQDPGRSIAVVYGADFEACDFIERDFHLLSVDEEASRVEFELAFVNPDEGEGFENEMESKQGTQAEDRGQNQKTRAL